ncbi:MAG: ribosome maturation factor RimM [Oscillospiraceae bacterium]|nr:ribosome maturation factor RimM [Oscillospiraceae bacterium]
MKTFLEIARFTKPQGLKGDLRAQLFCDSPDVLFDFDGFYMGANKSFIKAKVCELRKGFVVMSVQGVDNIEKAEKLTGETLYIDREDYKLPENTWFIKDLLGLNVVNADTGERYGVVKDILQSAPKDVYVVKSPEGRELLFPSIPEVLVDINITERIIKIRPLEGLFD